ncbi:hypothetical protein QIS99_28210 [Streptomyces sp. B-S-A8]|uniref:Putative Flp pilus-assembly TadG-like N-terminal domain-containing protein n=1 Tax=Streptomyces solicavernae TaxID=3043614 RepID=A0ABT6S024_9ACTN|nr:pilus assembly protein TadG-related protein [Streptomyces sp. B-S-A8]MDI3390046.1 hypothetical protein [Streptomyces sp. B-S-A8]
MNRWLRALRTQAMSDKGSVTLYYLGFGIILIGLLALMTDMGRYMKASADSEDLAAEAARAAGQQIIPEDAIGGHGTAVDPAGAEAAAAEFLEEAGSSGTARVSADGQKITVTVHDTYEPILLSGLGFGTFNVTARSTATLVRTDPQG